MVTPDVIESAAILLGLHGISRDDTFGSDDKDRKRKALLAADAEKSQKYRNRIVEEQEEALIYFQKEFPTRLLRRVPAAFHGQPTYDYGRCDKNRNAFCVKGEKSGTFTIGLCYENKQKEVAYGGRECCKKSEEYMEYLLNIEWSLLKFAKIDHSAEYLRVQFIKNTMPGYHTDSYRGNHQSYIYPMGEGYKMSVRMFPNFRTSVVKYKQELFIPIHYNETEGLRAYRLNESFQKVILPIGSYSHMEPYGEFDFVVVGQREKKLVVAPLGYHHVMSPTEYPELTLQGAMERLTMTGGHSKYFRFYKSITRVGRWSQFISWKHIHCVSEGGHVPRITAFFRPMRQKPTCNDFRFQPGQEDWENLTLW